MRQYMSDFFSRYIEKKMGDIDEIKRNLKKIIEAVKYIHDGNVSHNDIKLENMLFDDENEPVLSDFGLASVNQNYNSDYIRQHWKNRDLSYAGPEVFEFLSDKNAKIFDMKKQDIFALG